jgi:hypothetical protein
VVEILEAQSQPSRHIQGSLDCQELSEKVAELISCEDTPSRHAGGRIMLLLLSHGKHHNYSIDQANHDKQGN